MSGGGFGGGALSGLLGSGRLLSGRSFGAAHFGERKLYRICWQTIFNGLPYLRDTRMGLGSNYCTGCGVKMGNKKQKFLKTNAFIPNIKVELPTILTLEQHQHDCKVYWIFSLSSQDRFTKCS